MQMFLENRVGLCVFIRKRIARQVMVFEKFLFGHSVIMVLKQGGPTYREVYSSRLTIKIVHRLPASRQRNLRNFDLNGKEFQSRWSNPIVSLCFFEWNGNRLSLIANRWFVIDYSIS